MNMNRQPPALGELLFLSGSRKGQTFQITKARTSIGRQPDTTNDLIAPEASVSRHHAEVLLDSGIWRVNKLSMSNTLFINKQEVQQGGMISNQNVIGLGPDVELLFLSYLPEKKFDPGTAPTVYRPPQPVAGGNQGQPVQPAQPAPAASDNPFKNPGHPAWQVVSIFTGLSGILIALEAPAGVAPQVITALITLVLCAVIVLRARRVAVSSQGAARRARFTGRKALLYSLLINVMLALASSVIAIVAFILTITSIFSSIFGSQTSVQQALISTIGISLLVFSLGILISFITVIVQIFSLLRKKLLSGARVLGIAAAFAGVTAAIIFLTTKSNPTGVAADILVVLVFSALVLCFESLVIFILVGIYLLVRLVSRRSSSPSKVSTP